MEWVDTTHVQVTTLVQSVELKFDFETRTDANDALTSSMSEAAAAEREWLDGTWKGDDRKAERRRHHHSQGHCELAPPALQPS